MAVLVLTSAYPINTNTIYHPGYHQHPVLDNLDVTHQWDVLRKAPTAPLDHLESLVSPALASVEYIGFASRKLSPPARTGPSIPSGLPPRDKPAYFQVVNPAIHRRSA